MKKIFKLFTLLFMVTLCLGLFTGCSKKEEEENVDYSKLTFEDVFTLEPTPTKHQMDMPNFTMAQLRSKTATNAYPSKEGQEVTAFEFQLRTNYSITLTGVSYEQTSKENGDTCIWIYLSPWDSFDDDMRYQSNMNQTFEEKTYHNVNLSLPNIVLEKNQALIFQIGATRKAGIFGEPVPCQFYNFNLTYTFNNNK